MPSCFPAFARPPLRLVRKVATTLVRCYGVSGLQSALHLGIACRSLYTYHLARSKIKDLRVDFEYTTKMEHPLWGFRRRSTQYIKPVESIPCIYLTEN